MGELTRKYELGASTSKPFRLTNLEGALSSDDPHEFFFDELILLVCLGCQQTPRFCLVSRQPLPIKGMTLAAIGAGFTECAKNVDNGWSKICPPIQLTYT